MSSVPRFRETQRFRQPWLWVLLGLAGLPAFVIGSIGGIVIVLGVTMLFAVARLETEVREDGVYIRFAPLHRSYRQIPFDEVAGVERAEFGLLTYGGLGIRWTADTWAYMTRRGHGVKIRRPNAKAVVIGSERPEELLEAIEELR